MKAVIFDLGNVLVEYDGPGMFTAVANLLNVTRDALITYCRSYDAALGTGQLNGPDFYRQVRDTFGGSATYDTFAAALCSTQQRNDVALAFARALAARPDVKVGIISNTNEVHVAWLRANLPELNQFSSVIMSNEVGLLKPEADIFELSLAQLGVAPAQALFVDDVAENVAGATAVGLAGLHHTDWPTTRHAVESWLKS
ncbi:MAG: HAD family phosphatase [Anaerolineaceae bacterium]|nr:HAD family phosphatase [Anaerolineaceae bacterium]